MPFFRKPEVKCVICEVPGWEGLPFSQVAQEWAKGMGPCEDWGHQVQTGNCPVSRMPPGCADRERKRNG